jgi:hypothetical protein
MYAGFNNSSSSVMNCSILYFLIAKAQMIQNKYEKI